MPDSSSDIAVAVIAVIAILLVVLRSDRAFQARERQAAERQAKNPKLLCPHCQVRGTVQTCAVQLKRGVSGGKVVLAVFTGGISMLLVGLSRKIEVTKAACSNCNSVWHFE